MAMARGGDKGGDLLGERVIYLVGDLLGEGVIYLAPTPTGLTREQ